MKYKNVVKHAFSELSNLKESYRIATAGDPNPKVMLRLLETILALMNPIMPLFCQYQWANVLVPALKACQNLPKQPAELLVNQGWPEAGPEDEALSYMVDYLQDVKSTIRQGHIAATTGGKGKKGKGKEEEKKPITTCVIFYNNEFPTFQKRVLEILKSQQFVDNEIQSKDYIAQIRGEFKDKKVCDNALKFAAFTLAKAKEKGVQQTMKLEIPFDEREVLSQNNTFLYENMPTVTNYFVFNSNTDEHKKIAGSDSVKDKATPGQPVVFFTDMGDGAAAATPAAPK